MDITDENFETEVIEKSKTTPIVVDFWAPWCGPCRMLSPTLEKLEKEYNGKFILTKLNVDQYKQKATEYNIMSIPCIKIFKDGKEAEGFIGALPEEGVRQIIDKALE